MPPIKKHKGDTGNCDKREEIHLDVMLKDMDDSDERCPSKKHATNEVSKVGTFESYPGKFRESEQKSPSTYSKTDTMNVSETDSFNSIIRRNNVLKRFKKMDFVADNDVSSVDALKKDIDKSNEIGSIKVNSSPTNASEVKFDLDGVKSHNDRISKPEFGKVKETCCASLHKTDSDLKYGVTISAGNDPYSRSTENSISDNCVSNEIITVESSSDEESLPHTIVHPSKKLKFDEKSKFLKHYTLDKNFKEASAKSKSTLNKRNQPIHSEESFIITQRKEQVCEQNESGDKSDELPRLPSIAAESDDSATDIHKKEFYKYNMQSGYSREKVHKNTYLGLKSSKSESETCQSKTSTEKSGIDGKPSKLVLTSQKNELIKKQSTKGDKVTLTGKDRELKSKMRKHAVSAETKSIEQVDREGISHSDTRNPLEIKDVAAVVVKILSKYHQHRRIADKV